MSGSCGFFCVGESRFGPLFDVSMCLVVLCPICSASSVSPDKPIQAGWGGVAQRDISALLHEGGEAGGLLQGQGGQARVGSSRSWITSRPGPPARSLLQCTCAEFSIQTS